MGTSSIASSMRSTYVRDAMSFMEKNHERAQDADAEEQSELIGENLEIMKDLLAHFQERLKKEGEKKAENLKQLISDLKAEIADMVKGKIAMKAYIAKMVKAKMDAVKANKDRAVGLQKMHEQANDLTDKITSMDEARELNFAFDDHIPTGGFDKVNKECKELTEKEKKNKKGNDEDEEESFLQTQGEKLD